jgi:hypothetical protein
VSGPLPDPNRRRRNAPTIPTTNLPAKGRKEAVPKPPSWVNLGTAGSAWWKWAWKTPQAAGWDPIGHLAMVARRAGLEDDLATIADVESLDLADVLGEENFQAFAGVIRRLAALATGRLAIFREMRELDDRLGLTPKGLAALRWTIIDDGPAASATTGTDEVAKRRQDRRKRLSG